MVVTSNVLVAAVPMKMVVTVRRKMFEVAVWMLTWQVAVEMVGGISAAIIEDSLVV